MAASDRIDWSVVIVIIIGTLMAVLDGSIVNVALPKIMAVFSASPDNIQWVLTGYIMALGVIMPVTGYLGDTFGYKRMYCVALSIFTLGSALCGISWSVNSLVAARILQAIGGGIMQPLGMAFIYRITPHSRIGLVLGIWGIAAMAAPAIGPTLGGYLVEYVSWRIIFYINVPIGTVNLFLASMLLNESKPVRGQHLDWLGLFSSSLGLFCLLFALSEGAKRGWTSPFILGLVTVATVSLVLFIINELQHPEPLLELRLFKNSLFTMSTVVGCVLSIGMFGGMFLLPLLLQSVLGLTAMQTGLMLFPAAIATALTMPVSGRIFDRFGPRGVSVVGLALVTWTTYMMGRFNDLTPFRVMISWLVVRGMAMGLSMMPVTTAGMTTVPKHLVGKGSALTNVMRQVAASLGIALFTTVMQDREAFHFSNLAQSVNFNSNSAFSIQGSLSSAAASLGNTPDLIQGLSSIVVIKQVPKLAIIQAINDCFILASAFCLVAFILSFFLKPPKNQDPCPAPGTEAATARG